MPADVIVGLHWGDEGKGKIVDFLALEYDLIVRYQGGNNAGHTVVTDNEKYALHLIPSGAVRGKKVALGNGMVINPKAFLQEVAELRSRGLKFDVFVSDRAHIITPEHVEMDKKEGGKIGTTGRGIGPAYTDKVARRGIRAIDYAKSNPEFGKFVCDVSSLVNDLLDEGKYVLLEGAQGTMLDIDHGSYPYVTSSSTTASGACTGVGISPKEIENIIGVAKAYTTRVGKGPFPTELNNEVGEHLRNKGNEYGTTTGRPRRCGWFDGVVSRYSSRLNRINMLAITKLDVLTGLKELKIATSYLKNGEEIARLPVVLDSCEPNYISLPGWSRDISNLKDFKKLPKEAIAYLCNLADICNCELSFIGVGPERTQIIDMQPLPCQTQSYLN